MLPVRLLMRRLWYGMNPITDRRRGSSRSRFALLFSLSLFIAAITAGAFALANVRSAGEVHAATLVSVQSGTTTIPIGATGTTQTVDVAITSVNTSSSVLFFNYRGNSTDPGDGQLRGQLTSATNIQFVRANDTSTTALTVQWYVAEFSSGVSVQRGTFSSVDTTGDVTIGAVDLSKSFVLISGSVAAADATYADDDYFRAQLTSATNLRIVHNTAASKTADWQVVEFTGATVQRSTGSITGTQTSAAVPISSVDLSKTIVLISWKTSISGTGANFLRARLTSPTEITIDRAAGTSATIEYAWEVIQFADGTTVESGNASQGTGTTSTTATLTSVNLSRSVALLASAGGRWGGSHAFTTDDQIGPGMFTTTLTNSTTLTVQREITGSVAADAA